MDKHHARQLLETQERELTAHIARLQSDARETRSAEVEDQIDTVNTDTGRAESFEEGSREYETLAQVRDALQRLDDGTYGTCIECGRPIEPARLEAVPWTPYCIQDQEKRERLRELGR